ncbi:MAG: hypothetical protein V2I67_21040 [Thermoanaerobaculales bacterium]|jgi:hypothetical protein|nr:hypothetical protein [Thermoanaerobaculales bacterium]
MYVIVLTIDLPAQCVLRTMCVRGNPREAHPGSVFPALKQAAARPSSVVTSSSSHNMTALLGRRWAAVAVQAKAGQKAGVEGIVRIRSRSRRVELQERLKRKEDRLDFLSRIRTRAR